MNIIFTNDGATYVEFRPQVADGSPSSIIFEDKNLNGQLDREDSYTEVSRTGWRRGRVTGKEIVDYGNRFKNALSMQERMRIEMLTMKAAMNVSVPGFLCSRKDHESGGVYQVPLEGFEFRPEFDPKPLGCFNDQINAAFSYDGIEVIITTRAVPAASTSFSYQFWKKSDPGKWDVGIAVDDIIYWHVDSARGILNFLEPLLKVSGDNV